MGELILILGGARSGKTKYAQDLAHQLGGDSVLFVATAEAGDSEMQERITAHRRSRPATWQTLEAAHDIGPAILRSAGEVSVVLVDCLTLLVSNAIMPLGEEPDASLAESAVMAEVEALLAAWRQSPATFIIVSNEVGLGLVPPYPLGRVYRDVLGLANQAIASQAQRVYFMVAGTAMVVK